MAETAIEQAVAAYAQSIGSAKTAADAWRALHTLFDTAVGAKLFTVTTVDLGRAEARRLYTSDPASYPVSGAKPIVVDPWYELVIVGHQSFVANTLDEISGHFPDYALIGRLGCGSVINLPVLLAGSVVATVNCLDVEHHYTPQRVATTQALTVHALAAYLVAARLG